MPTIADTTRCILNAINPYHWVTWLRNRAFDYGYIKSITFDTPTICIGNITVGGTGKTPHTEYLVRLLKERYKVAVLSRGYGRKSKGYVLSDERTGMEQIGDEPYQIKQKFKGITVAVDEKRVHGIEQLMSMEEKPEVILLDDAYQHRYVKAGINILLIDYNRPIWSDPLLPIGRLRESADGISRANIIIITKCPDSIDEKRRDEITARLQKGCNAPIFFSHMKYGTPYPIFPDMAKEDAAVNNREKILLLTGIAKPAPLKKKLEEKCKSVTLMQYADHHNFSPAELKEIASRLAQLGEGCIIVTTEKDAARLAGQPALPQIIKEKIYALPIEVEILFGEQNKFNQKITDYVTEDSRDSRLS